MNSKKLRILIWNDDEADGVLWRDGVRNAGFKETLLSSELDPEAFTSVAMEYRPDLLIMDLFHRPSRDLPGSAKGFELLSHLRRANRLVPALCASTDPEQFLRQNLHSGEIDDLGITGIHSSRMLVDKQSVCQYLIGSSLRAWSERMPHFAVCHSALRELQRMKSESFVVTGLIDALNMLPRVGSLAAWHGTIISIIASILEEAECISLASTLRSVGELFENADTIYMASSSSREHLTHDVLVAVLGLKILCINSSFYSVAEASFQDSDLPPRLSKRETIILAWLMGALCHDIGYVAQEEKNSFNWLRKIAVTLDLPWKMERVTDSEAGVVRSRHHASLGVEVWNRVAAQSGSLAEFERKMFKVLLRVVLFHDLDFNAERGEVISPENWEGGLAVLCDEMQDWGRSRPTGPPGTAWGERAWSADCVERFEWIEKTGFIPSLEIDTLYRTHAKDIVELNGASGLAAIEARYQEICRRLLLALPPGQLSFDLQLRGGFDTLSSQDVLTRSELERKKAAFVTPP